MAIERTILSHLVYNDDYARKVLPFLQLEYFENRVDQVLYGLIDMYMKKYNGCPTKETLEIELSNTTVLNEQSYKEAKEKLHALVHEPSDMQWLLDNTEKFCQDQAILNAIQSSIHILDGTSKEGKGAIPEILSKALAVSFDSHIGHDYFENYEHQYDYYHKVEHKIPFSLDIFNKITKGGVSRKTLNILLAGTGVGKSLSMCSMAADNLMNGSNVLYISNEMAEEEIRMRIDANLLNVSMDELNLLPKDVYVKKIEKIRAKTVGRLIIKEYPTASASVAHYRHLLNELRLKKNFKPDIIYVDYLNIMTSARIKSGSNVNSYTLIKSIAEELRGLAIEFDVAIVSATQTNRSGFNNSDVDLTDTSDSFGLPMTADFMVALINTEDLEQLAQLMIKQLKNRYSDKSRLPSFVIGIDRMKMRLYDCEQSAQADLAVDDSVSVFDRGGFGEGLKAEKKDGEKKNKFRKLM